MIDSFFRPKIQKSVVERLLKNSFFKYIHPNVISFIGCALGLAAAVLIYFQLNYLAVLTLLMSGLFDTLDGSVARLFNKKSNTGCLLDISFDRLVESSIIFSLFLIDVEKRAIVSMYLMGSALMCVTSFLVVGMFTQNTSEKSFYYSPGLCERGEAFIFFNLMILFPKTYLLTGYIFATMMLITAFTRTVEFIRQDKIPAFSPSHEKVE